MLYVSDHGESLGENGLYLHGFPYSIAPPEQTRVPMLFWGSPSFYASHEIDSECVRSSAGRDVSHDWIYHTLLPLFGVTSGGYDESLDLFAACRGGASPSGDRSTRRRAKRSFARLATLARRDCRRGRYRPALPRMCSTSWLFSLQMYSIKSQPGRSVAVNLIVKGFAYAPGSVIVVTFSSVPSSLRV